MSYSLDLDKEYFKFSSSHFTIFDKNQAEALHGHNYHLSISLEFETIDDSQMAMEFSQVKSVVKKECELLDEKVLVPIESPFLKISKSSHYDGHTEVIYNERHYVLPTNELSLLPLKNITSEGLAQYMWAQLSPKFPKADSVIVSIVETDGQSVSYTE